MWLNAQTKDLPSVINIAHIVYAYPSFDGTFVLSRDVNGEVHKLSDTTIKQFEALVGRKK